MAEVHALQQNSKDPQGLPRGNYLKPRAPRANFSNPPGPWRLKKLPPGALRAKNQPQGPRVPLGSVRGEAPHKNSGGSGGAEGPPSKENYLKNTFKNMKTL